MKICYIFIATGKYELFVDGLISSCIKHFFCDEQLEFFIFTDSNNLRPRKNVNVIYQKKMGWPFDTLMRFHLINSIKDKLDHDFIFFSNVNMFFLENIGKEILPFDEKSGLVGAIHPGFHNIIKSQAFPLERRPDSTAYVGYGEEGENYFQGCFFGGKNESFLEMTETLQNEIQKDLDNNIIAIWHDESHMNKYFIKNPPKKLDSGYVYPPSFDLPYQKKIFQLGKTEHGGINFLRS